MAEEKHDAQEVKEIMQVVSTEIPKLLEAITKTIYDSENAESFGKAVAEFYKQMKAAGMDDKQAYELTQKYMTNFSLGGMVGQVFTGRKWDKSEE
jgi:phosphotransacetylase